MCGLRQWYGVGIGLIKFLPVIVGLLLALPALAQQPNSDPVQRLARDWSALNGSIVASDSAQAHVADDMRAVIMEYQRIQKHAADLDAYLRACKDQPGCTVPVASASSPPIKP